MHSTFIKYKSGRKELVHHKNKKAKELARTSLSKMNTIEFFRTPTKADKEELRNAHD